MPLIEADFSQDYEDKPAPEGKYDLRIRSAKEQLSKGKADQVLCLIDIEGADGTAPIFHYLTFPLSKKQAQERNVEPDDEKKFRDKMRFITRFLDLFEVPYEANGFNTEDLVGASAKDVDITQEEGFEGGGPTNSIKLPPAVHK